MPELPEVETTINYLRPKLVSRKIKDIWTDWPKGIGNISFDELQKVLKGKSISALDRRGKNILVEIDKKITLWIHLKMTGHLLLRPTKIPKNSPLLERVNQYIHFRFMLDKDEELAFSDLRKFGRVRYIDEPISKELKDKYFSDIGPEPLEKVFDIKVLEKLIKEKKESGETAENIFNGPKRYRRNWKYLWKRDSL